MSLLYSCATVLRLGFNGSGAPLTVWLYDLRSFRSLRYVGAHFKPARPGHPRALSFQVMGPDALIVKIPKTLPAGIYAFVVHNKFSDVAWAFLTVT